MTSHTPSPWEAYPAAPDKLDISLWCVSGAHPTKVGMRYTFAEIDGFSAEAREATARLIAAAPELLAACKAAREVLTCLFSQRKDGPGRQAYEKLSAAIAKAEGK